MTIQEYAASAIEKSASDLIQAALTLPEDKRDWKPQDKGRSALSQIAECAVINELFAQVVETGVWSGERPVMSGRQVAALETFDDAMEALRGGTAHLAGAVREAADANLSDVIPLPWRTLTLAQVFLMPLWNMSYHEGQINYIGTLL